MNILFVARGYPTNKYKTNGIFEFDQASALVNQGCKVIYAAIDVRSLRRWRKWGIYKIRKENVYIYTINIPLGRLPKYIIKKISYLGLKYVYKIIEKEHGKPDIIHSHFPYQSYIAAKLKEKTEIPLIVTEHLSLINSNNIKKNLYDTAKYSYENADSIIAVSPALQKKINLNFNKTAIMVPNMYDSKTFKYKKKNDTNKFNFVSTGHLKTIKRMDLTIKAFHKAFKYNPDVVLTIFGDGPEKNDLEELINKLNMKSQIILKGMVSREIIADKLAQSDCFVLASKSETFGVSYVEALAVGVPVIATKCGGPESFLNEDNGVLVNVDDEKELVESMIYMYNNIDKYHRKDIADYIKTKYSSEMIAKKLVQVYCDVLTKKQNIII